MGNGYGERTQRVFFTHRAFAFGNIIGKTRGYEKRSFIPVLQRIQAFQELYPLLLFSVTFEAKPLKSIPLDS